MKVCKYCGAENENRANTCSSCGGNEFKWKCDNCKTVFEEGNYCPKCGVKAGTEAKKCPNCGAEYYSKACPDCGYTSETHQNSKNATVVYVDTTTQIDTDAATQPVRKRKTWLWVLGWIFIFPVPLTVLMVRNQKLSLWLRIVIVAVAWLFYLGIGYSSNYGVQTKRGSTAVSSQTTVAKALETESKQWSSGLLCRLPF